MQKIALVVGVGPGLGSAVAYKLLKEGYKVYILARSENKLKEIKESLSKYGSIDYIKADASNHKELSEALSDIKEIDALVLTVGNYKETSLDSIEDSDFSFLIDPNLKAPINTIKALKDRIKSGSSIVLVSSIAGTYRFAEDAFLYSSIKAAVAKLTENLAAIFIEKNVRVNCVAPLSISFDFKPERDYRADIKLASETLKPELIADVISFLLSEESYAIDGAVIPVDAGARLKL
ncbi:MAG: 3-ketoacyl-ACP reductase [Candidatus Micrarchaeota archaeon]|nr:MAG: 3-ketoacyl-ACP reductase [Candidatus Micrarchaeota archaeon]